MRKGGLDFIEFRDGEISVERIATNEAQQLWGFRGCFLIVHLALTRRSLIMRFPSLRVNRADPLKGKLHGPTAVVHSYGTHSFLQVHRAQKDNRRAVSGPPFG